MSFDSAEPGTPERAWRAHRAGLPPLDLGPLQRLLVVAAHPDDETLMAGGLIAHAGDRGLPVDVVVASSGEASHPGSRTRTPAALAAIREAEVVHAIGLLAPDARVHLLRLPDGGLAEHRDELLEALAALVRPGATVVSTWSIDGHPDHAAVAEAAAEVARAVSAVHLQAPIWAWHRDEPRTARWPAAVRLDLSEEQRRRKREAVLSHRSQVEALSAEPGDELMLHPGVLEHFLTSSEVFVLDGTARPVDFGAMYDAADDPWGFADRWYERRKRALLNACLPRERLGRVLEIGCSIGLGSRDLALRAEEFVGVDVAPQAVEAARLRLQDLPHARIELRTLPDQWPEGWARDAFDTIVLSETGFYLAGDALVEVADRCRSALAPGGVLVGCHWRPHVLGLDRGGDAVQRVLRERLDAHVLVRHEEDDFVLEVLQVPPTASVAQATGLR